MTDTKNKVSRLANTDVFRSIPEEQLGKIATVLKEETVPAKTVLFQKGDPGYSFYIIHSGKMRVYLTGEDGVETDLNILGPGDSFGEMALITDDPRSTNVEALEETHLFVLAKEEFQGILKDHPEIFKNVFKYMSDLIKRDDRRLQKKTEREYRATRLSFLDFVFIGIVILLFASIFNLSNPNKINVIPDFYDPEEISKVDLKYAKKKFDEGETIFIDARPANFYEKLHIKGARNLPLPSFEINYMYMPDEEKKKDMIVYGRSIGALYDEEVARQLQLLGHDNVQIYKGPHQYLPLKWFALDAWQESKYPVEGAGHE